MAALALAMSVFSSAIYDFMRYLLTKVPRSKRGYYAKTIKESFRRIILSAYPDITMRKNIQLQNRLTECLQSPDIDKDKLIDVLQEEGLSRKTGRNICSKVFEEFKVIVGKEAIKNPDVFRAVVLNACTKYGVTFKQITTNLSAMREEFPALRLVLEASQAQLDRIEKKVTKIAEGDRVIIPTIQSVLRRNDPNMSEGTFFRKEPAWMDFENGFIVERKEVDRIIESQRTCNVHLVLGGPSSGKSLVLKNVGFKLAKANKNVYVIELRKISERKAVSYFNKALKMKGEPVFFIVDDAHYQLAVCEEFVREFRNTGEVLAKLLVGSRKTKEIFDSSPKLASGFENTHTTELFAGDVTKEIIRIYLRRKFCFSQKEAVTWSNIGFYKYEKDLWILSWALMAFDPKRAPAIEDERIYEKIRDSIRNLGRGAEDALFPMSVLYRFEIPIERNFLEEHIGIEERVVEQLIESSEIVQIEETGKGRTLALIHSSIAELYFEAYKIYPDLGKKVKRLIRNDIREYSLLQWYLTKSDPTHSLEVLIKLGTDWANRKKGLTLLARLLENEGVRIAVREGIAKETDLDTINMFITALFWGVVGIQNARSRFSDVIRKFPSFKKRYLMRMYWENGSALHRSMQYIAQGEAAGFYGFSGEVARIKKNLELILTKYVDFDNLLAKIRREQDMTKAIACTSNITRVDEKLGLVLARKIDFSKIKKKDFIELTVYCSNSGSFELFSEILRHLSPEKKKQLKNFLKYLGVLARPHFAQLRN